MSELFAFKAPMKWSSAMSRIYLFLLYAISLLLRGWLEIEMTRASS